MIKRKTLGIVTISGLTAIGLAISTFAFTNDSRSIRARATDYTLTLNSSNGITGSNVTIAKNNKTDNSGYDVEFQYNNCSALNDGHATINANGSIVNNDHIRSIDSLTATFTTEGELKFRTSYDGSTWGGYTSMDSGVTYGLGSNPYYVEFTTDGNHSVNLTQVVYSFTCEVNPEAHEDQVSGESYYQKVTSDLDDWTGNYLFVNVKDMHL